MPNHPSADADSYVYRAAVDENEEMVEMVEASRQYQNDNDDFRITRIDDAYN